jgi:hypothetical protein
MDILSNDWFNMVASNYSIAVASIPTLVGIGLKVVAITNPNVPTDKIEDLLKLVGCLLWRKK